MQLEDLKKLTLETPVYHPFIGRGFPTKISENEITIKFKEGVVATFGLSGSIVDTHFISHLYLKPIKIVDL